MRRFIKPPSITKPIFRTFSTTTLHDVGPMASHIKTRSVVRFSGPDTIKFLQGLIINDVRRFGDSVGDEKSSLVMPNVPTSSARSLYAVMLTPQGRFLFDLFLYEAPRVDERIDPGGSGPGSGQDEVVLLADVDCSVLGKWKTLNRDCTKFNAYYKRLQREEKSRESEMDILKRAKQMYRDEHKTAPFNNEEAWEVLRGHKKWDVPDPLDLTDDVPSQTNEALVMMNNHVPWAKHVSKKAKSESTTSTGGASTGGTSSSSQFGEAMASEYRIKRETALAAHRAAQVKDETITRLEEMKFLMIDTYGKDPNVVCWINEENDRIIKKYNLQPRY